MDSYIHEQYQHACAEIFYPDSKDASLLHSKTMYLTMRYFMQTLVNRTDRAASANSLDIRVPFADFSLAEYLFNVPYEMKAKDGEVKHLPEGSTALDFAYAVHSAIGEKVVGAKADGKIIPLTQELKNTQIIEVLTNPQAHPTENQLKYAKTSKARQKIHAWLVANDPNFLDKASAKQELENAEHSASTQVIQTAKRKGHKKGEGEKPPVPNITRVKVAGMPNFIVTFAQCCHPAYPDAIVGYVSFSKGVTIHKADCLNYLKTENIERRTIPVEWDTGVDA